MTPRGASRERLRARQACRNCRKKKARCPSEKPACSSCVRLNRLCVYDDAPPFVRKSVPAERLTELEQKVDLLLSSKVRSGTNDSHDALRSPQPTGNAESSSTPQLTSDARPSITGPAVSLPRFPSPGPSIPEFVVSHGVDVYFQRFHRQPVWCFDRQDLGNLAGLSTELIYSILELTARFVDRHYTQTQGHDPQQYGQGARFSIMLRMANNNVEQETIESLCLLSYSAFIDGDMRLGQFYLGLGFQLCRSANIDQLAVPRAGSAPTEREKRVFWSLQLLEQHYGDQNGTLRPAVETWRPYFLTDERDTAFPKDTSAILTTSSGLGIWALSLHFDWSWAMVREYVSESSRNASLKEPWRLDSTYRKVLADLTEIENKVPLCHRYNAVRFHERQPQEVQRAKDYWMPWMKLQFTWHSILMMVNHPFLYITASQYHPSLAIPNTFWRRSLELVLLHATWIVRTIDMASEKEVGLVDPFFAHASAIAATVHLYFCCTADLRLREKLKADFTKCKQFLKGFSSFSPACQRLTELVDKLTAIAMGSHDLVPESEPSKIKLSIPLMWAVLQFDMDNSDSQGAPSTSDALLPPTSPVSSAGEATIEIGLTGTPPAIKIDPSEGHDSGLPPYKAILASAGGPSGDTGMANTPWLWSDPFGYASIEDVTRFPWDSTGGIHSEGLSTWWNLNNL